MVLDALGFGRPVAGKLSQIDAVRFSLGVGLGVALVSPLSFALGQMFLLAGGRISNVSAIIILAFVLGLSLAAATERHSAGESVRPTSSRSSVVAASVRCERSDSSAASGNTTTRAASICTALALRTSAARTQRFW